MTEPSFASRAFSVFGIAVALVVSAGGALVTSNPRSAELLSDATSSFYGAQTGPAVERR